MMRTILKSKKGISPILATLLLIVIAVAAVIVTYAWVMTFTGSTTSQAGAVLTLDNTRFYNTTTTDYYVEVTLRNSGTADATVASVYVGTSDSNLAIQSSVDYLPTTQIIEQGSSINITITYDWTDGTNYYFNIVTEEGLSYPFQKEA